MPRKRKNNKEKTGAPMLHSLNPNAAGVDMGQRRSISPFLRIAIRNPYATFRPLRKTSMPRRPG